MKKRQPIIIILLLVSSLIGMALVAYSTVLGPGIGGDATIYITAARNFISGKGLGLIEADGAFRLLPYFPPGFPLLLSLFGLTGIDMIVIARWLNIVLFGGLIFLFGRILMSSGSKPIFAWFGSLLIAFSPVLVPVSTWAMSEPLALLTGFASLVLLIRFLVDEKQDAIRNLPVKGEPVDENSQAGISRKFHSSMNLVWAGLLAGVALLTRYNAVAFALTGGLFLVFTGGGRLIKKLQRTLVYSLLALIPLAIWIIVDVTQTQTVASRRMEFPSQIITALASFWNDFQTSLLFWVLPDSWIYTPRFPHFIMNAIVPAMLLGLITWYVVWRKKKKPLQVIGTKTSLWINLLITFCLVYLVVTIFVKFTTYPPITINTRMLSPLYAAILLVILLLLSETMTWLDKKRWVVVAMTVLLGFGVLWYGWITLHIVPQFHRQGQGYMTSDWQQSETLAAVRSLPEDIVLITNQDMLVLLWTGRAAYPLKEIYLDQPLAEFSRFGDGELTNDKGQQLFRRNKATLVLFDTISDQLIGLYGEQTRERVQKLTKDLTLVQDFADGGIYSYHEP